MYSGLGMAGILLGVGVGLIASVAAHELVVLMRLDTPPINPGVQAAGALYAGPVVGYMLGAVPWLSRSLRRAAQIGAAAGLVSAVVAYVQFQLPNAVAVVEYLGKPVALGVAQHIALQAIVGVLVGVAVACGSASLLRLSEPREVARDM